MMSGPYHEIYLSADCSPREVWVTSISQTTKYTMLLLHHDVSGYTSNHDRKFQGISFDRSSSLPLKRFRTWKPLHQLMSPSAGLSNDTPSCLNCQIQLEQCHLSDSLQRTEASGKAFRTAPMTDEPGQTKERLYPTRHLTFRPT